MSNIEPHDNVNPFQRRQAQSAIEVEEPDPEPAPADSVDEPQSKKDAATIAWKMKMAAAKAAKKIERDRQAAIPAGPDKPIVEAERLRQKLANWLPDATSFEAWKRVGGKLIWVGDYTARDAQSSKNVRQFIYEHLYKKHRAREWEIVFVSADGKERAPHVLNLDPDATDQEEGGMNSRVAEKLDEIASKPSQMKEAVAAMRELKDMQAQDAPQGPQPTTIVEYLMMRDMMKPAEDPRIAAMAAQLARLEAFMSQPPPMPMSMPPAVDPMQAAVSLAQVMMAPMQAQLAAQAAASAAAQAAADRREDRIRDEIKEARKSASTGGHGGLEALRDQIKLLKEIEQEQSGSGGGELTKLVSSIGGFLKDMKAQEQATAPAAAPPAQQQQQSQIVFPPGFDEKAKAIATATTDPARLEAALLAYQHIIASSDPIWLRFHSLIVEHAKKGEKDKVREYVAGFLEGCVQWVPEAAQKATLAAFDAKSDGVILMLAGA